MSSSAKWSKHWIAEQNSSRAEITPERVAAFASLMREKLAYGDIQARKAYLRSIISGIEDDERRIQIINDRASLADVVAGSQARAGRVRGFVRKWRTRRDSNPWPLPSEGSALSS